eukprot:3745367-Rhodomonas_salina.1
MRCAARGADVGSAVPGQEALSHRHIGLLQQGALDSSLARTTRGCLLHRGALDPRMSRIWALRGSTAGLRRLWPAERALLGLESVVRLRCGWEGECSPAK